MGSHIASVAKLAGLRACLHSIAAQSWAARHGRQTLCLLISWSAESEDLRSQTRRLLTELVPDQVALEQPCKRAQFEHYSTLVAYVTKQCGPAARRRLWVGFTDDDDIWHPERLETFYIGIARVEGQATVTQLRFPWFAVRRDGAPTSCENVRSAAQVEAMLRRGHGQLWNTDADGTTTSEHWTAVARLELLAAFFVAAPAKLLESRFADLAWERFSAAHAFDSQGRPVVPGGESVVVKWTSGQPWMYFYNVAPGGSMRANCQKMPDSDAHASSGIDAPTAAEREVATRLLREMPGQKAAKLRAEGDGVGEERLARKLAHLRRNLSITCAQQLWPLRWCATAEQLHAFLLQDLQRTWQAHPAPERTPRAAEDYVLLNESRPLRVLLQDLEMPSLEVADRFEAHCEKLAAAALKGSRR